MKLRDAACFASGVAAGIGIAFVSGCIFHAAVGCLAIAVTLCAGIALGRASKDAEPGGYPDEDLPASFPMVPDRPIPMDHEHGEE